MRKEGEDVVFNGLEVSTLNTALLLSHAHNRRESLRKSRFKFFRYDFVGLSKHTAFGVADNDVRDTEVFEHFRADFARCPSRIRREEILSAERHSRRTGMSKEPQVGKRRADNRLYFI